MTTAGSSGGGTFAFRALHADGALEMGTMAALSIEQAQAMLFTRGVFPIEVVESHPLNLRRRGLSPEELAVGLRVLADVLEAGLPIQRALAVFGELAPGGWAPAVPLIREAVRQGSTLAHALEIAPLEIPPLLVGMVRAGEAGSGIAPAMRRAAGHAGRAAEIRASVRAALAYPMVIAVAGAVSLAIMVGVVIPQFASILTDLGQQLPASTQALMNFTELARTATLPAAILIGLSVIAVTTFRRTPAGRLRTDTLLLQLPLLGSIRYSAASARVAMSLAALLESGVSLQHALRFAARVAGDSAIEGRLEAARLGIVGGSSLAAALDTTRALTPTTIRLIRAGEVSGRIPQLLEHAASVEERRVHRTVQQWVRFLEPALILLFAGVVGAVAVALLQAIYAVRPV